MGRVERCKECGALLLEASGGELCGSCLLGLGLEEVLEAEAGVAIEAPLPLRGADAAQAAVAPVATAT
jgi:hypothetical protein